MTEFIQQATQSLGVGESATESATGGLLKLIQGKVAGGDFAELLAKVPGAESLIPKAPADDDGGGGGGLVGGLLGAASSAVGGDLGSAAGIAGMLSKAGIGLDDAGPFVGMFLNFIKGKAGDGLVGKLLGQVPELAKLGG